MRVELIDDPTVVAIRRLGATGGFLIMGVVLSALLFRRLLSGLPIEQPLLLSFAISLVVIAIPWVIVERRARRMAPGSILVASWHQLTVFAASEFDSVPTVRGL